MDLELITPEGAGYMPLFCAALWIASEGGKAEFDLQDISRWRSAYKSLLDHISSGEVAVTGMREGQREIVSGFHFVGVAVKYPYVDTQINVLFDRGVILYSRIYIDEDEWLQDKGDTLERSRVLWSRLAVLKSDVLRFWPFEQAMPLRTGAPGRPTSKQLVEAEFKDRCKRGDVETKLAREGVVLSKWLRDTHSLQPQMTPKTISNVLRTLFHEFQSARK